MAAERERLDTLLVLRGLAETRTKARALILAGRVRLAERTLDQPGERLPRDAPLQVTAGRRWVSRGGAKLEPALAELGLDVQAKDTLDVGASTGGFTQALLEAGARRVIALDVGRGQLDWSLRRDERVRVLEGVNARHLTPALLPFAPQVAVVDVSFISLKLVLPAVAGCLQAAGEIVALVKPQFEVGRGKVGRGGIVSDPALHREVLATLARWCQEASLGPVRGARAALAGAEGNQEYFLHLRPGTPGAPADGLMAQLDALVAPREDDR